MAFTVSYRSRARTELKACAAMLGPAFLVSVEAWLQKLADEAEQNKQNHSDDAHKFLTELGGAVDAVPEMGLSRWLTEGMREKVLAVLVTLRDRTPPWGFSMAEEVFLIPNTKSSIPPDSPGVVAVCYEVDRINKRIIVTMFPELPCSL